MKIEPTIIIDTREQRPFSFDNLESEAGTLDAGDYSVRGLQHLIAVERKSLPDCLACVGGGRVRFTRELQRLRAYRFRLLVIETDAAELQLGDWQSQVHPNAALGSLAAWIARHELPIWLGGDHDTAGRFVERFLFQAARCVAKECAAVTLSTTR